MKKKKILFASCLMGVLALSSCEKNLYDESKQPEKETKMTDVKVPADFSWEMSTRTDFQITSTATTLVSIFADSNCSDLLFTVNIDPTAPTLPLVIPEYLENIYLKYETISGESKVIASKVNNGQINISVPADAKPSSEQTATRGGGKGDYTPQPGSENNVLQYPNKGYATVMFEDMFPQLGDYDFNDFVAWYKYQLQDFFHEKGKWFTNVMQIGFQIRAIGGTNNYAPRINLSEIKFDDIDDIVYQETGDGVELIEGPNGEAILSYTNPPMTAGSRYFNTEQEHVTEPSKNTSICIYFNKPINLDKLQDDKIDIYIAKPNNGTEIHLKGYEGIYTQDGSYSDKDNYVWGLKAPAALQHVIEKNNFLNAYPKFKDWIEGKDHKQWWTTHKDQYLIKFK